MTVVIEGDGPDLVLLHGGAEDADGLLGLRQRLVASGRRVLAPEQRAHGRTTALEPLTYAAMAADTAGLLDALDVRGADVVGWSDGGVLGLLLARDRPELVRRVVSIGGNASLDSDPTPIGSQAWDWFEQHDLAALDLAVPVAFRPALVAMWKAGPDLSLASLAGVTAPTLVICGDRDLVSVEHSAAIARAVVDGQLAVLPGAEHDVPRTRPDEVGRLIESFLAR